MGDEVDDFARAFEKRRRRRRRGRAEQCDGEGGIGSEVQECRGGRDVRRAAGRGGEDDVEV